MAAERAAALRAAAAELERVKAIEDDEDRKQAHFRWAAGWGSTTVLNLIGPLHPLPLLQSGPQEGQSRSRD